MFKVLIVDDTRSVHIFVKTLLAKAEGIEPTSVQNGEEAIEVLKNRNDFDLILLDWEMPKLNGPDTLRRMKEMGSTIPTVMMTTKSEPEDIMIMLEAGAKEYIMKPFTIDILFEKISYATGRNIPYGL
jgi:DNA-binding response OmpR family regulator